MINTVLVVVSHYNAWPAENLISLLRSVHTVSAGWPFDVRVLVNQEVPTILRLPAGLQAVEVYHRENTGYNIGAWEEGWRIPPSYDAYLFLQEECRLVREGWVAAFVREALQPQTGLVGECLSPVWDAPWEELTARCRGERLPDHMIAGQPADRVPCYLDFFRRQGIPPGARGDHLQSLILFARRDVLEAMKGFPVGRNYGEAIAAEIGISKKVQALRLEIRQVAAEPFSYIEHPQWLHRRLQHSFGSCDR